MKKIILKELTLDNFKAQNRKTHFGEHKNVVSGHNGCGKSTLMKAWQWLLTGFSDAQTNANESLFDNTKEITPDTPTASVEALVSIDGVEYRLKRSAKASFSRKRGTAEMVKNPSDDYRYYVDNIEYNATEFKDWISANICQEDMLRYAISGDFFIKLCFSDKKKARLFLEKTVGTVERSEMIGDYTDIDELLQKFSPDQIEERAKNLSKGIDQHLNEIPSLISSKETEMTELQRTDFATIQKEIDTLEAEQRSVEEQILDYSARMKPQLEAKAKAESDRLIKQEVYDRAKKVYEHSLINIENKIVEEICEAEMFNNKLEKNRTEAKTNRAIQQNFIDQAEGQLARLREQRDKIKSSTEEACPVCGGVISGDKLEAHKRKALDNIVSHGKELSADIDKAKKEIELLDIYLNGITPRDVEPLKQKLHDFRTNDSIVPFELTEQGATLRADIDAVEVPEVKMPEDAELKRGIADIKSRLRELYMKKGTETRLKSLESDIVALRSEQREKGAELAKYERLRQVVKAYKQEQMEILSRKVNDGLRSSIISVWSQQKDGTIIPDIVLKNHDGVIFSTANNASRITTTVDIQRFFCECLGVNFPTWIDECAIYSKGNLPHFDGVQTFYLFCSDTELTVRTE